MEKDITLRVDGEERTFGVDTRTTLLDALREQLGISSPKKGCDHGQCGSCTVMLDGRRHLTCLALAVGHDGSEILTAAGLGEDDDLHEMQKAFIEQDGYQCGYCTPGQICSAIGMLDEVKQGHPSHVSADLDSHIGISDLSDEEIRERMSGNLCRCGAYVAILAAVRQATGTSA